MVEKQWKVLWKVLPPSDEFDGEGGIESVLFSVETTCLPEPPACVKNDGKEWEFAFA